MPNILENITILYVEEEESLRIRLVNNLKAVIKKVYVCNNGIEALSLYKKYEDSIDIIISTVNIPGINGIELLKEVRKIHKKIPFMINTMYLESELLLEAIEYDVTEYVSKSITIKDLLVKIAERHHERFSYMKMAAQEIEMTRYLDALNKVAIVSKTDLKGIITYVNEIFCEVAQYKESELLGKPHNIIRHPDMPKAAFKEMWETIQAGQKWQGKVKNKAKDGSPYFVNATMFPQYDEAGKDIIGYIAIRFLTTDDENEKREFKKKVIENLQDSRKKQLQLANENSKLETQLDKSNCRVFELENYIGSLQASIKDLESKNLSKERQLNHYELQMHNVDESYLKKMENKKREAEGRVGNIHDLRRDKDMLVKKNNDLESKLDELKKTILNSKLKDEDQRKRIRDLSDIVQDLEKKIRDYEN